MKRITFLLIVSLVSVAGFAQFPLLEIGTKAPLSDVKMKDVSGKMISLDDAKKQNGVLVIFSCNTCPFVVAWEDRYNGLQAHADDLNIGMLLINSNSAKRSGADSFSAMKKHADEKGYKSMYVVDEKSELANAFGAKTTPHVFLFNGDGKLVYMGAIDDNHKSAGEVKETWLKDAMTNLSNGEEINPAVTRALGCSIKR